MAEEVIEINNLHYRIGKSKVILEAIDASISKGSFVALLGENGAGKTTLLDLLMGFRKPTGGRIKVMGEEPYLDHWKQRSVIAYLSEKVDIPGDWSVREFLSFNSFFYEDYSTDLEHELLRELRTEPDNRVGNLSAGEIRRVQIIAALSIQPRIAVIDEISAVLDIIGRRKFMRLLHEQSKVNGMTVLLATNILEDLSNYISDVFLISRGKLKVFKKLDVFLSDRDKNNFSQLVADTLEEE